MHSIGMTRVHDSSLDSTSSLHGTLELDNCQIAGEIAGEGSVINSCFLGGALLRGHRSKVANVTFHDSKVELKNSSNVNASQMTGQTEFVATNTKVAYCKFGMEERHGRKNTNKYDTAATLEVSEIESSEFNRCELVIDALSRVARTNFHSSCLEIRSPPDIEVPSPDESDVFESCKFEHCTIRASIASKQVPFCDTNCHFESCEFVGLMIRDESALRRIEDSSGFLLFKRSTDHEIGTLVKMPDDEQPLFFISIAALDSESGIAAVAKEISVAELKFGTTVARSFLEWVRED